MPSMESGSDALVHDQMVVEALEHFCSSSEQSYKQFLASFSHLSAGSIGKCAGSAAVPSALDSPPGEMERHGERRWRRGSGGAERGPRGSAPPADQDEILLGSGADGTCGNGDVSPGALLKVDSSLAAGDLSQEEEGEERPPESGAVDVLPGEVEDEGPAYLPSFSRRTMLEMSSTARSQGPGQPQASARASPQHTCESEEVTVFCLDETFDYDHVVLSHKHHPWPHPRPGGL